MSVSSAGSDKQDGACFDKLAETIPSVGTPRSAFEASSFTCAHLSDVAKEAGVWILAGEQERCRADLRLHTRVGRRQVAQLLYHMERRG